MKSLPVVLALLSAGLLPAPAAFAAPAHAAVAHPVQDAMAPVFIVTSRKTFDTIHALVRNPASRRDSLGNELVVSEAKTHMLDAVSEAIHRREKRCGGFFAFATRAEADRFIADDRSALAARSLAVSYTIDNAATVDPWLPQASEAGIHDTIDTLQSYRNRYYASSYGKAAAEWIRDRWESLAAGRGDVTTELFTGCTNCSTQPSVILTIRGNELPDEVVVLGAHLDSINGSAGGNPEQVAPGADDDASGIATLTETLRIALASGWKPQRTVKFMAYAAEEAGLRGSNAIARQFKADGVNVVGALQLDMTEYKAGTPEDMQLITDYSNAGLQRFFISLFDAYLAPMRLRLFRPRLVDQRRIPGGDDVRGRRRIGGEHARAKGRQPEHPHHRRHAFLPRRIGRQQRQVRAVRAGVRRRGRQDQRRRADQRPAGRELPQQGRPQDRRIHRSFQRQRRQRRLALVGFRRWQVVHGDQSRPRVCRERNLRRHPHRQRRRRRDRQQDAIGDGLALTRSFAA
jgi:leucyl aminopeptidase